jgi:hypothetical protein
MALEKATILPIDQSGNSLGDPIPVLFNPTDYSMEESNQFQSTAIPGLSMPVLQFVNGNSQTLTMELFFDTYTYQDGLDVRSYTEQITSLMDINADLHAPPLCVFSWGRLNFKAVLERVTKRFTMFLDSGIPVRATLNVTFKEYRSISEQLQNPARQSSDRTKYRVVQQGDTLALIAYREYQDPAQWRPIATANSIDNPRLLEAGMEIIIPPLE